MMLIRAAHCGRAEGEGTMAVKLPKRGHVPIIGRRDVTGSTKISRGDDFCRAAELALRRISANWVGLRLPAPPPRGGRLTERGNTFKGEAMYTRSYTKWMQKPYDTQQIKDLLIKHNDWVRQLAAVEEEERFGDIESTFYGRASTGGGMEQIHDISRDTDGRNDEHPDRVRIEREIERLEDDIEGLRDDILAAKKIVERIRPK
jgi:hypothetical protein